MSTIKIEFPAYVPSLNQQFTRSTRYIVGFYSGSCFVRRGEYDCYERAVSRQSALLEHGLDARVIEVSLNLYLMS